MTQAGPNILIVDPAPEREALAPLLAHSGMRCTVAHGLHDAMVQAILRHPRVVVADLTRPDACGQECLARLTDLPHFAQIVFLTIGDPNPAAGALNCPPDVTTEQLRERVVSLLQPAPDRRADDPPSVAVATSPVPIDPAPASEAPPAGPSQPNALADALATLKSTDSDGTVVVAGPEYQCGEVLVRGGLPIHAVTHAGEEGEAALAVMSQWPRVRIEIGPAPRPETPVTIAPPMVAPTTPPARDLNETRSLLAELEGLGILRKVVDTP